jgi:hypothetical protein
MPTFTNPVPLSHTITFFPLESDMMAKGELFLMPKSYQMCSETLSSCKLPGQQTLEPTPQADPSEQLLPITA